MTYDISSPSNNQVKRIARLRERRHRDEARLFPVEEERIVLRAVAKDHVPGEVYICPDLRDPIPGLSHRTMSRAAMDRASYRSKTTGLLALFPYFDTGLVAISPGPSPLILVCDGIEKPGNLGALLRVADGAGVDAVIVAGKGTDVFNPNTVRASTGALFSVPIAVAGVDEAARWLGEAGISSVGADPEAAEVYWYTDLSRPLALWVGSEAAGLSAAARDHLSGTVAIPMRGESDSLNATVAAALLVYESARQRSQR